MNKEDLLEYLSVVCDAENAIQACEDATNIYRDSVRCYTRCSPPNEPLRMHITVESQESGYGYMLGCFSPVLFFLIAFALTDRMFPVDKIWLHWVISFGAAAIAYLLSKLYAKQLDQKKTEKMRQQKQQIEDSRYASAFDEYQRKLKYYEVNKTLEEEFIKHIETAIQTEILQKNELQKKLKLLYSKAILHPNFQNIIAVNQIREYLEMGVCDQLDGPAGAYKEYLQDVRAQKIITSIDKMKNAVVAGLQQIASSQTLLLRELQQTNDNLIQLRGSIQTELNTLESQISRVHNSIISNATEANASLKRIDNLLSTSAHNQYIALRHTNIDSYLLKNP